MAKKIRLDQLLVQRGLAETLNKAQALILAGAVRVGSAPDARAGNMVSLDAEVVVAAALPYASRGGYKLAHALDSFGLAPAGLVAIDVGASTGGFTDVLLQRGAARVYAVDVGYGLLDWRLRQDARVVVLERTNIRYLEALPGDRRPTTDDRRLTEDQRQETRDKRQESGVKQPLIDNNGRSAETQNSNAQRAPETQNVTLADCATIDVAFISLRPVLPALRRLLAPGAWVVALVKPQFEAAAELVGKGGVVRDPAVHAAVLRAVLGFAVGEGLTPHGLARSPITGPAGNVEFLAWLGGPGPDLDVEQAIHDVVAR
jgi:23S rRNA (cytidine1920-2'-O)/16S rRNA (cytidine1409-2'-O)-methyltransferase